MLTPELTEGARALLSELSPAPQLPALIYDQLTEEMGFDPSTPVEGLRFDGLGLDYPPMPLTAAVEAITGTEYATWVTSDMAKMIQFLNTQPTQEWPTLNAAETVSTRPEHGPAEHDTKTAASPAS